jgi:secondary thiamine-phosphate synthase enzyme
MHTEFSVSTVDPIQVIDVTEEVVSSLPEDAEGVCTVFVAHTTAGVVVQEAERRLLSDIEGALERFVPDDGWRHDEVDDNADAHVRAALLGESVTVPVSDGRPDLGTWQSILFVECDGPRTRTVKVVAH